MRLLAIFIMFILIFGLVGCDEPSVVSPNSDTESVSSDTPVISGAESEETFDPSEIFPNNMSVNDFITNLYIIEGDSYTEEAVSLPKENTQYCELLYGCKYYGQSNKYVEAARLDLRSIENKGKVGRKAARESHIVMIGDCLLIAVAVYDMKENVAYVVEDSTNSTVWRDDRHYTHTDPAKASGDVQYGQAVKVQFEPFEQGYGYNLSYGYPVWHYVIKKYNSIPDDYVLTLTERLYENDEVVSEEVTLTLTYQDIQELLS